MNYKLNSIGHFCIIYPSKRCVSPEELMTWATDAYYNHESTALPEDPYHAAQILEDIGHITLCES